MGKKKMNKEKQNKKGVCVGTSEWSDLIRISGFGLA